MKRAYCLAAAVLLLGACPAGAAEGAPKPVPCKASDGMFGHLLSGQAFAPADKDSGLGDKAVVTYLSAPFLTPKTVRLAVENSTGGNDPDRALVDFSGKGKFDKAAAIAVKKTDSTKNVEFMGTFGPAVVKATRNGTEYPVSVSGAVLRIGGTYLAQVMCCSAVEGRCTFGKKEHAVRILDASGSLTFDHPGKADKGGAMAGTYGDILLIDTGDGKFTAPQRVMMGQPVLVDGAWYEVAATSGKIEAKPSDAKASAVCVQAARWEAIFTAGDKLMVFSGAKADVPAPAGKCKLVAVIIRPSATAEELAMIGQPQGIPLELQEGKTLSLAKPLPFKGELAVAVKEKRAAVFSYKVQTADNLRVAAIMGKGGITDLPAPPVLIVTDSSGKEVHKATMEFG